MATYQQYPTPPSTSSPKHSANYQSQSHNQSYDYSYPEPSPFSQPQAQPFSNPSSQPASAPTKVSAQESYFHSYSAASSPLQPAQTFPQPNAQQARPPRRRSSPLLGPGGVPYSQPLISPRHSPRPLHYSPLNKPPSPYNAGRPKPRPGFLRRIAMKLEQWIKAFVAWTKKNPMTAGVITFIPVMTIAGVVKVVRVLGKGLGLVKSGSGGGGGFGIPGIGGAGAKGLEGEWGWGLDEFKSFGGSKGGPFGGMLKIVQMLV